MTETLEISTPVWTAAIVRAAGCAVTINSLPSVLSATVLLRPVTA